MVRLDDDIVENFPELTFFLVSGQWNKKFQPLAKITVIDRIFCTLENSLSIRSVLPFLVSEQDNRDGLFSIEFWNSDINNKLEWEMNGTGIAFAETGKVYRRDDLEEFKKDYLIAQLSGIKQ